MLLFWRFKLRDGAGIVLRLRWRRSLRLLLALCRSRSSGLLRRSRRSLHAAISRCSLATCVLQLFESMSIKRGRARLRDPVLVGEDVGPRRSRRLLLVFGKCQELNVLV